ncbi:hypothetical protein [Dendrosporobacter sp. 1207_IL3150]|uniref:hypothetical protein n=1 Tax=Dendrosporobacter sp. 1207_IL3150 TaxID=3084054 RepID=UPI002FD9CF5C
MREHLEVINHREAIIYRGYYTSARKAKRMADKEFPRYRAEGDSSFSGAEHVRPDFMQDLMKLYQGDGQNVHPVERAMFCLKWQDKVE